MTPHQSIAVGVRLFAVWLLLAGLGTGYFAVAELGMGASATRITLGVAIALIWVFGAVALWRFPRVVARKLLSHEIQDSPSSPATSTPDVWLAAGCALIGVWVVVSSLPAWAQNVVDTWPAVHLAASGVYFTVRILLGVALILGARFLRKFFRWTQYAGIRRSEEAGNPQ